MIIRNIARSTYKPTKEDWNQDNQVDNRLQRRRKNVYPRLVEGACRWPSSYHWRSCQGRASFADNIRRASSRAEWRSRRNVRALRQRRTSRHHSMCAGCRRAADTDQALEMTRQPESLSDRTRHGSTTYTSTANVLTSVFTVYRSAGLNNYIIVLPRQRCFNNGNNNDNNFDRRNIFGSRRSTRLLAILDFIFNLCF